MSVVFITYCTMFSASKTVLIYQKVVIRCRKSNKDRQYIDQKDKEQKDKQLIHKTLHRRLDIEQHELHKKEIKKKGILLCAPNGKAIMPLHMSNKR